MYKVNWDSQPPDFHLLGCVKKMYNIKIWVFLGKSQQIYTGIYTTTKYQNTLQIILYETVHFSINYSRFIIKTYFYYQSSLNHVHTP